MVGSISHAIAYGMHNVVYIDIPHGHVICLLDHVVCLFQNDMPHGWDYFYPQQNIVHIKYYYIGSCDMPNGWKTTV